MSTVKLNGKIQNEIEKSEITRAISIICEKDCVYELRAVKTSKGTQSGYFSEPGTLANNAEYLSGRCPAVYITINPAMPTLLARANNRTKEYCQESTDDNQIVRRTRLLIDCDPVRPSGVSSTDAEHEAAIEVSKRIQQYLTNEGFPLSCFADSGNGGHNLYRIDLPNDSESLDLIKRFLEALAKRFNTDAVTIDTTVFNASRISKLYGTITMKGDSTDERPHRFSRILESPEILQIVPVELLKKIGGEPAKVEILVDSSNENVQKIKAYCAKVPAAYGGTNGAGEKTCFGMFCNLVRNFGYMDDEDLIDGVEDWNLRCVPVWNDAELWHKLEDARKRCEYEPPEPAQQPETCNADDFIANNKKPTKEESAKKYTNYSDAFIGMSAAQHPIFVNRRFYMWDGTKYVEREDLDLLLRRMFASRDWSQSNNVIGNVKPIVEAACWRENVSIPFWDGENQPFDNPKHIISFSNGLLDISKSQVNLMHHTPQWCSTFCLPFAFDSKADCPKWKKFLTEIFPDDDERALLLQEFFGYCLTQDTSLQKALVLVGKPRSGKGTIQRVLGHLIGKNNSTGYSLDSLAKEFGLSSLVDKSVAMIGEVELSNHPQKMRITEILKSIIGEDEMSINKKHDANMPSMRLPTRFVVATNTIPRLMDSSGALAQRFLFIPFLESFVNREDTDLEAKLISELPGIANWAMAGLERLRANKGKFTLGAYHKESAEQFAADTSPIISWIKSELVVSKWASSGDLPERCISDDKNLTITKEKALDNYRAWCEENNIAPPVGNVWFAKDIRTVLPKVKSAKIAEVPSWRGFTIRE